MKRDKFELHLEALAKTFGRSKEEMRCALLSGFCFALSARTTGLTSSVWSFLAKHYSDMGEQAEAADNQKAKARGEAAASELMARLGLKVKP